jgi:hypothetical protein
MKKFSELLFQINNPGAVNNLAEADMHALDNEGETPVHITGLPSHLEGASHSKKEEHVDTAIKNHLQQKHGFSKDEANYWYHDVHQSDIDPDLHAPVPKHMSDIKPKKRTLQQHVTNVAKRIANLKKAEESN